jgi:serine/threonine protein kinase
MEEQFIGNYKILKKIGAGGMAKVYLAVHKDVPNLKVVLKILTDSRLADRFRQEADKLALLDGHPNICRIKHFFNHGDDLVIAMEYIEGDTLDEVLKKEGKLPISEALRITAHVLDILETAHQKDIYHRDIKPSNIMVDKVGNVKIIDFGIAKSKGDPSLTIAGTACGTPSYMAPEQFGAGEDFDFALVDIYAVGTTLFQLTTGELPFRGENQFVIRDAKLSAEAPSPRKFNPEISRELEAVILKSLRKDPVDRFQSALEMKRAISPLMKEQKAVVTGETDRVEAYREPVKKSKTLPIVIGIAAVIVVAAILIYMLISPAREPVATGEADTTAVAAEAVDSLPYHAPTSEGMPGSPRGSLELVVKPAGDVYFDGELVGKSISSKSLTADTGMHSVFIRNSRAINKDIDDSVRITPDKVLRREYAFEFPRPADTHPKPAPPDSGVVKVGSWPPRGDIYINDRLNEEKTPYTFTLVEGKHIIRIELAWDGEPRSHIDTVVVKKGVPQTVMFDTRKN